MIKTMVTLSDRNVQQQQTNEMNAVIHSLCTTGPYQTLSHQSQKSQAKQSDTRWVVVVGWSSNFSFPNKLTVPFRCMLMKVHHPVETPNELALQFHSHRLFYRPSTVPHRLLCRSSLQV